MIAQNAKRNRAVMEYWRQGFSYSSIARFLGISRNAVAGVVYRHRVRKGGTA